MKRAKTISLSLQERQIAVLDRLARDLGSRSEAVRWLLSGDERSRAERDMEEAYRAYYAQPGAAEAGMAITREMVPLMSWPDAGKEGRRVRR